MNVGLVAVSGGHSHFLFLHDFWVDDLNNSGSPGFFGIRVSFRDRAGRMS